jgi:hypothetical protein
MKFRHFDSNISEESPALGVWVFVSDVKLVLPVLRSSYSTLVRQSRIDIKTDSQSTAFCRRSLPVEPAPLSSFKMKHRGLKEHHVPCRYSRRFKLSTIS